MIIYPPFIGDTIPAFTTDKIVIPFSQNPAVSIDEVSGFKLIIKDYLSSNIIAFSTAAANSTHLTYNVDTKSGEVIFTDFIDNITKEAWVPTSKQYYKFQMSYSDNDTYNDGYRYYIFEYISKLDIEADEGTVLYIKNKKGEYPIRIGATERYVITDLRADDIQGLRFEENSKNYALINYTCKTTVTTMGNALAIGG